ncbi:hypothetical protein AKJ16_DCAP23345 [Drosera capensis]
MWLILSDGRNIPCYFNCLYFQKQGVQRGFVHQRADDGVGFPVSAKIQEKDTGKECDIVCTNDLKRPIVDSVLLGWVLMVIDLFEEYCITCLLSMFDASQDFELLLSSFGGFAHPFLLLRSLTN